MLNTRDQTDLLSGDAETIAGYLGVSVRTVKRWKSGQPMPAAPFKLMQLRHGDLSAIGGADWEGFYFGRDNLFYHPFFKYGFNPYELKGLFFNRQEVAHFRREVPGLKAELKKWKDAAWATGKVLELFKLSMSPVSSRANRTEPPPCDSFAGTPR